MRCSSTRRTGWWPGMLELEAQGVLHRRGGELRFLDLWSRRPGIRTPP